MADYRDLSDSGYNDDQEPGSVLGGPIKQTVTRTPPKVNTPYQQTTDDQKSTGAPDYSGWNTPYESPTAAAGNPPPATGNPPAQQGFSGAPFNYEGARDSWMSGRYSKDEAGARQWATDYGISYNGGDVINLPNGGGMIDILSNWGGGQGNGQAVGQTWTPAGGNGDNPNGVRNGGGGSSGSSSNATAGMDDSLIQLLLKRANQSLEIDPANNAMIRQQADPYIAQQTRAARDYIADQAERQGPNANLSGEARVANEHAAQAGGQFEAGLIGKEIDARRQEIQSALSQYQQYLTDQQRMDLQRELGYLNDATQRLGISNSYDLGLRNIGLEDWDRQNYWDAVHSGQMGG